MPVDVVSTISTVSTMIIGGGGGGGAGVGAGAGLGWGPSVGDGAGTAAPPPLPESAAAAIAAAAATAAAIAPALNDPDAAPAASEPAVDGCSSCAIALFAPKRPATKASTYLKLFFILSIIFLILLLPKNVCY